MPEYQELFQRLAVAFSIGLLIGLERGWKERGVGEGQRVAGLRTFGLIALFGAVATLLAERYGGVVLGFAAAALVALLLLPYAQQADKERGITTEVAALLTFVLGAAAAAGYTAISASAAVVTALILGMKPQLHAWVARLEQEELLGALKLLLISVVLLPILPNRGYGPWEALNPYQIWLLVVLIAGIAFVGYFAMKLAGPRSGTMLMGFFGGLISSTAVALNFSRLAKENLKLQPLIAAGIVVASATMFPRVLMVVAVINSSLLPYLAPVIVGMTLAAAAAAGWLWHTGQGERGAQPPIQLPNPFELLPALGFGALLVVIMLASTAASHWFGAGGAYVLAVVSGIGDVDSLALAMARLAGNGIDADTAARAIVIAAFTNTIAKGLLVFSIGDTALGRRVAMAFAFTLLVGGVLLVVVPLLQA